jgi:hypothetical protein
MATVPSTALLACILVAGCLAAPPPAGDDGGSGPDGAPGAFQPLCSASGMVGHWSFEGDLSATIADPAGGNDGVVVSAAPRPVPGQFGQAGEFLSDPTGFVVVPDADALDLAAGSLEIWTLFHSLTQAVVVARDAMFNPDIDEDGHLRVRHDDDGFLRVRVQHAASEVVLESDEPIAVDQWIHIVVNWGVETGSGPGAQLYVGSSLDDERATPFKWSAAINPLVFGTDQDNAQPGSGTGTPSQYLDGNIDEIVVCSEPVTP